MDYNLKKRCNNSVGYYKYTGISKTGVKTYATATNLTCYRIGNIVKHYGTKGEELTSQNIFYFEANSVTSLMSDNDLIELNGSKLAIIKVNKYYTHKLDMLEVFA
jgi:hypothetical protein